MQEQRLPDIISKAGNAISLEFYPPKTEPGWSNLQLRIQRMLTLRPAFVSVTFGAGGSTSSSSLDLAEFIVSMGVPVVLHLTCTNMPLSTLHSTLKKAQSKGIKNILALRGDPPFLAGEEHKDEYSFEYAIDLIKYIKKNFPYFCVGCAAYPEGHVDGTVLNNAASRSIEKDLPFLMQKIEAGAEFIITQLFYDATFFLSLEKTIIQDNGIKIPIIPVVLPIQSYQSFKRLVKLSHASVPSSITETLEKSAGNDEAIKQIGVDVALGIIKDIHLNHIQQSLCLHFCTLNLEKSVATIVQGIQHNTTSHIQNRIIVEAVQKGVQDLEVAESTTNKSAIDDGLQKQDWDDFPNGRHGDARSPAFGSLKQWQSVLNVSPSEALSLWGNPQTQQDITNIMLKHLDTSFPTPWSSEDLNPESQLIKDDLINLNKRSWWTLSSQPAVDGAESSDSIFGWGPSGGWVYQKAFIELFVPQKDVQQLQQKLLKNPDVSFYFSDFSGQFLSNMKESDATAVTWGVFPGKEIMQPTIIEEDEAYMIWEEWEKLFAVKSSTAKFLKNTRETCWLVNIVHHNFQQPRNLWELLFS